MSALQTIKVASPASYENPLGFIIINRADFDATKHEPFDDEARAALAGAVASGERVPTAAELLAARDELARRAEADANSAAAQMAELRQMRADLEAQGARMKEQAAALEAEAQRLRDEAAKQVEAAPVKAKAKAE